MTKAEIKKAATNKLIVDYVQTYSTMCLNINIGGGTKRYSAHCADLEKELVARSVLTEEDVKLLNM